MPLNNINKIAVALSFSPYCYSILEESHFLSKTLNAKLLLIHVGEKTNEKELQLQEMLKKCDCKENIQDIAWISGAEVKGLLNYTKQQSIDLLILGARVKENIFKFYIGSIARKICRKSHCSVLLFTSPNKTPNNYEKIVINGTDNANFDNTVNTAFLLAQHTNTKTIYIINELDTSLSLMTNANDKTETLKSLLSTLEERVKKLISNSNNSFKVIYKTLKGKAGFTISTFSKSKKANLLVVNAPDIKLGVIDRIFTHDLEFILANLPCNLLIVKQKKN